MVRLDFPEIFDLALQIIYEIGLLFFLLIYLAAFFVIQWILIRVYIRIGRFIWTYFPFMRDWVVNIYTEQRQESKKVNPLQDE